MDNQSHISTYFLQVDIFTFHLIKKFGGVLKSMLTLNEAIIDVKEG